MAAIVAMPRQFHLACTDFSSVFKPLSQGVCNIDYDESMPDSLRSGFESAEFETAFAGVAQVTIKGARYAATTMLCKESKEKGQPELPASRYFSKRYLVVIGRAAAVADIFGAHLSASRARLIWAFIHHLDWVTFQSRFPGLDSVGGPGFDVHSGGSIAHP